MKVFLAFINHRNQIFACSVLLWVRLYFGQDSIKMCLFWNRTIFKSGLYLNLASIIEFTVYTILAKRRASPGYARDRGFGLSGKFVLSRFHVRFSIQLIQTGKYNGKNEIVLCYKTFSVRKSLISAWIQDFSRFFFRP